MPLETSAQTIAGAVQFAIAPIFMLVAVGSLLGVMTHRLGRVIDRARELERQFHEGTPGVDLGSARYRRELRNLETRMTATNRAIFCCGIACVIVCVMIALLFFGAIFGWPVSLPIASLFILTMASLIVGMSFFLFEIFIAVQSLHVPEELLSAKGR